MLTYFQCLVHSSEDKSLKETKKDFRPNQCGRNWQSKSLKHVAESRRQFPTLLCPSVDCAHRLTSSVRRLCFTISAQCCEWWMWNRLCIIFGACNLSTFCDRKTTKKLQYAVSIWKRLYSSLISIYFCLDSSSTDLTPEVQMERIMMLSPLHALFKYVYAHHLIQRHVMCDDDLIDINLSFHVLIDQAWKFRSTTEAAKARALIQWPKHLMV